MENLKNFMKDFEELVKKYNLQQREFEFFVDELNRSVTEAKMISIIEKVLSTKNEIKLE